MKYEGVKKIGSHKLNNDGESAEVYEVLTDLYKEHGELTAEHVIAEAEDEDSPLHTHFQWDDEKAAHMHRLKQARDLIGAVEIKRKDDPRADSEGRIRAFVNVTREVIDDNGDYVSEKTYLPTTEAMADEETRDLVLKQAMYDLDVLQRKYGTFRELAGHLAPKLLLWCVSRAWY